MTYGASNAAAACLAQQPADAADLIAELALPPGRRVDYREEVRHPALTEPEVATGTVYIARDGALVRDQVTPERQISEAGETMLSTRSAPEAEPTLYPIPDAARPMLRALGHMLEGDAAAIASDFALDLGAGDEGWRLSLRPRGETPGPVVVFGGCGGELRTMESVAPDGVQRRLIFIPDR